MRHKPKPPRTSKTTLTDDQLLLLDFLFDKNARLHHLEQEDYRIHLNIPYTHTLDHDALEQTVSQSLDQGVLHTYQDLLTSATYYGLTAHGGWLWETERAPEWASYCRGWYDETAPEEGNITAIVQSPSLATAQAFLADIYPDAMNQAITTCEPNMRLIPWKAFAEVYTLKAPIDGFHRGALVNAENQLFRRKRQWWRAIWELPFIPIEEKDD